ncbi:MAG TPA: hypothetical protein VMW83_14195 [Spirochaetia bacterium]|nr:hypothetical protein [Spirochaetia bacterium]
MVSAIAASTGMNVTSLIQATQKSGLQGGSVEEKTESSAERIREAQKGEGPQTSGNVGTIVNKLA